MKLTGEDWYSHSRSMANYCRDKIPALTERHYDALLAGKEFQAWIIRRRIRFFNKKANEYDDKAALIWTEIQRQSALEVKP